MFSSRGSIVSNLTFSFLKIYIYFKLILCMLLENVLISFSMYM